VVKSDRLDFRPTGQDCSPQAWPYYETNCLRDRSRFAGQAKPVRVITTDRIAAQQSPGEITTAAAIPVVQPHNTRATIPSQGH
jgi:hypothetical protein